MVAKNCIPKNGTMEYFGPVALDLPDHKWRTARLMTAQHRRLAPGRVLQSRRGLACCKKTCQRASCVVVLVRVSLVRVSLVRVRVNTGLK